MVLRPLHLHGRAIVASRRSGEGRVLVVDGGGSLAHALMGDQIGGLAAGLAHP